MGIPKQITGGDSLRLPGGVARDRNELAQGGGLLLDVTGVGEEHGAGHKDTRMAMALRVCFIANAVRVADACGLAPGGCKPDPAGCR